MFTQLLTVSLLFLSLHLAAQHSRKNMEDNYAAFIGALKAKDPNKLKSSIATAAYVKMKNAMLSSKSEFPETLFESVDEFDVDFKKMKFLRAPENGVTGSLIYYDTEGENVLLIKFINEGGLWKFSEIESYGTELISTKMKANDLSFLEEKKFKPDGIVPVVEKELKSVEYMAMLDVNGDYYVSTSVNGINQGTTNGGSKSGILIGGLKKGKNTIEIRLRPIDGTKGSDLSVSVRIISEGKAKEVFVVKTATPAMVMTKEFQVQ